MRNVQNPIEAGIVAVTVYPSQARVTRRGRYRRTGGMTGQAMTVASALSVIEPLARGTAAATHAPGPSGLPGGYPVTIGPAGVSLDLAAGQPAAEAIRINSEGQRHDGIRRITDDGYIEFEDWASAILHDQLGYDCPRLHWSEADDRATELRRKYVTYAEA